MSLLAHGLRPTCWRARHCRRSKCEWQQPDISGHMASILRALPYHYSPIRDCRWPAATPSARGVRPSDNNQKRYQAPLGSQSCLHLLTRKVNFLCRVPSSLADLTAEGCLETSGGSATPGLLHKFYTVPSGLSIYSTDGQNMCSP